MLKPSQIKQWQNLLPKQSKTEFNFSEPFAQLTPEQLEDLAIS